MTVGALDRGGTARTTAIDTAQPTADDIGATAPGLRRSTPVAEGVHEFLEFEIASYRYGVRTTDVAEVLRAVTVVPLPKAPRIVEGVITIRGTVVPVLDVRARFGLAPKPSTLTDHLIVAWAGGRRIAFRIDRVIDLVRVARGDIEDAKSLVPGVEYVAGLAKLADGLMVINDFGSFLSQAEADSLTALEHELATS